MFWRLQDNSLCFPQVLTLSFLHCIDSFLANVWRGKSDLVQGLPTSLCLSRHNPNCQILRSSTQAQVIFLDCAQNLRVPSRASCRSSEQLSKLSSCLKILHPLVLIAFIALYCFKYMISIIIQLFQFSTADAMNNPIPLWSICLINVLLIYYKIYN